MNILARVSTTGCLMLALFIIHRGQATAQTNGRTTTKSGQQSAGIKKAIPRGMLLHVPARQPACSKLPTTYELGSCFQLDTSHCLLVGSLDEQGGPDLCVGNDAFVFEKLSDINPEKAIIINRAEPEYVGPGQGKTSFLAKYPVSGFFQPLGALLPDGRPHPAAGTGLLMSVCVAYIADRSDPTTAGQRDANWKSWENLVEFIQVRWNGKKLTLGETRK